MKIFKIIYDNIPNLIILSLLIHTYFNIGPLYAFTMTWLLFLRRFVDYVQNERLVKK